MSGIIFAGCSFTHGHGLWFYEKKLYEEYFSDVDVNKIGLKRKNHHMRYKDIFRFPRLVSQELKMFEIVRYDYSGCDEDSLDFIKCIFDQEYKTRFSHNWRLEHYNYDEIKYIIFQTSQPLRSGYLINENYSLRIDREDNNLPYFFDRYGFTSFDDFENKLINQLYNRIKQAFQFYENKGIKCLILNWSDDYNELIESDDFMKNRKIYFTYDNIKFESLKQLMKHDRSLIIKYDYDFFGEKTPNDLHPSKRLHEIIAKNIIDKINS